MKTVGYLRVSTKRQGASGLGLDAQKAAIAAHVSSRGAELVDVFVEIESGGSNDRPELLKALHLAKVTGATLVIAKLDRLSRNAAFLLALRDSGVRFVAADMPDANDLTVGIMALVAEQERQAISTRTKDALRAAKARGVALGNPRGAEALRRASRGNGASVSVIKRLADDHARDLRSVVDGLHSQGVTSLGSLASALNGKGILTPRGARWHKTSVRNLLDRQAALKG
jgi:DNA invertase Pin-like site-specific DNA recombinase